MPDIIRIFGKDVEHRLKVIEVLDEDIEVMTLGEVEFEKGVLKYPLLYILAERPGEKRKYDVLLSAGLHGDEPAGVYALLDFLDKHVNDYLGMFRFHIYPCINPSGFEIGQFENMDGINLNREFKLPVSGAKETKLVMWNLAQGPERYLFTMDMHECGETPADPESHKYPKEYFLYEVCPIPEMRVGDKIISALEEDKVPICKWPKIFEDINCNGVIWYPEGAHNKIYLAGTCFDCFLASGYTSQAFTTETAVNDPLESRVQVQLTSLLTALDEIARRVG